MLIFLANWTNQLQTDLKTSEEEEQMCFKAAPGDLQQVSGMASAGKSSNIGTSTAESSLYEHLKFLWTVEIPMEKFLAFS